MNRKSFFIPVGWGERETLRLDSNTLVLANLGSEKLKAPFDVERIAGSWSPHIPEKKARYRITNYGSYTERATEHEPVRLSLVGPGREILVPLATRRLQTCFKLNDKLHGVYYRRDWNYPALNCGASFRHSDSTRLTPEEFFADRVVPTCEACLAYRAVWCLFIVQPYEEKRDTHKKIDKEKAAEARRLRLPTAYARILDDDFLEAPSYKPPKVRPPIQEVDHEDEVVDHRGMKRSTSIERNRRLDAAKAEVRGHRR